MSRLYLETQWQNGKTTLTDCYFTQPFKVAKPFEEAEGTHIMVMTATAGMLQGDDYYIQVTAGDKTKTKLTNQSYTKIFNTKEGEASQQVKLQIQGTGELAWLMQPVIPFENSAYTSETEVTVSENAALCYVDIFACGRVGMGETFAFQKYHGRVLVKNEAGKLLYLDNVRLYPKEHNYQGMGYFGAYTHIGSVYLYGYEKPLLKEAKGIQAAISEANQGFVVRMAGNSGEGLYQYAREIYESCVRIG